MLLSKVKQSIAYRVSGSKKLPDDGLLQDFIQEATIYVAQNCDPAELIADFTETTRPLKLIEGGFVIKEPEYPDFTNTEQHLQIDEVLSFPVINYVCFLISQDANYKVLTDEAIAVYRTDYSRVQYEDFQ